MKAAFPFAIVLIVALLPAAAALADDAPTTQPAATSQPAEFDRAWVVDILADDLGKCESGEDFVRLSARTRKVILDVLCCGGRDELKVLSRLVALERACRFLPAVREMAGDDGFDRWLLKHGEVSRRLFRAIAPQPYFHESLTRLHDLVEADASAVAGYPDLAVAFAASTAADSRQRARVQNATLVQAFAYYTRSRASFRYDLRSMPYELSCHLADSRLPLDQRAWAMRQYGRQSTPAKCYFDVPYDTQSFYAGAQPQGSRMTGRAYTLNNIKQFGGICVDQAYFASEVCKALGIPAAAVTGKSESALGHAWTVSLTLAADKRRFYWDSATGRYEEQKYFVGQLRDPISGDMITDVDLMLSGAAAQLSLERREEADVATELARVVADSIRKIAPPDGSELRALAEDYNRRFAGIRPPVVLDADLKARRQMDADLVEELIVLAVQRNVAHRPAWDLLLKLQQADVFPDDHMDRFFDLLIARTAGPYPDYCCAKILQILPTIDKPATAAKVCERAVGLFPRRADLQGTLLLAAGEYMEKAKRLNDALSCYQQAADVCPDASSIVLDATAGCEKLMLAAGRIDLAIAMYRKLFARTPSQQGVKIQFRTQTVYYQVGTRLARLYARNGQGKEAQQLYSLINANQ